ncbi:MAG: hypothetical protein Q4C89_00830 [Deinococcus sp.]|uniref:hypothetical protein n=1 Tax=Deinococcus sp. TaxID=47478 RepID=UPI0026DB60B0|nr:hypothetical protein [Deinococcus sp.]MDO4244553.1 hypothetical protein [Deinococcus sp.]
MFEALKGRVATLEDRKELPVRILAPADVAGVPVDSGGIVVDDAAKTATLVWKFSDGSVRGVALATVIQAAPTSGGSTGASVQATPLQGDSYDMFFSVPSEISSDPNAVKYKYKWTLTTSDGKSAVLQGVKYVAEYQGAPYYQGATGTINLNSYSLSQITITGTPQITAITLDRTAGSVMFNFLSGMDIDVTLYDWTVTAGGQSEVLRSVAQAGTLDNRPYYSGETFTMSLAAFGANGIVVTGAPKS